ncbi:MAG: STAS/SEC14 domain-containing protein [Planctomycetales bacterium]|nr:STAS/SEC14 domain-containing protein [Planctomycetales bacterium]
MLKHKLITPEGILLLEPEAPLEASDFESVIAEIDPYIAERGKLPGVLIHAKSFPGWANLTAAMAHMRFVESHHEKIGKLAVVSDSLLLSELPPLVGHLIDVDVKHFPEAAYDDALLWLEE